jgi:hypothetical protein
MTAPKGEPAHLTTSQLAERWHTSPNAIRIRRSRGNAPESIPGGRERLWPLPAVEAWERDHLTPA